MRAKSLQNMLQLRMVLLKGATPMSSMLHDLKETTEYQDLIRKRSKSKWSLAFLMLAVYYGFILIIAFAPDFFAQKVGLEHTSLGIVVGLGVILFSFIITGIYVNKANNEFEPLTEKLHKKAEELGL
jgi:uncharacterized membrane protein (DUF485 family)